MDDQELLHEALALMRSNLAEPLMTGEVARYLGVTPKKLEGVFRRNGYKLPARFYLDLRLQQARQLLRHSRMSIDQVGRCCGFSSASHFSRSYREFSGRSPRDDRKESIKERIKESTMNTYNNPGICRMDYELVSRFERVLGS